MIRKLCKNYPLLFLGVVILFFLGCSTASHDSSSNASLTELVSNSDQTGKLSYSKNGSSISLDWDAGSAADQYKIYALPQRSSGSSISPRLQSNVIESSAIQNLDQFVQSNPEHAIRNSQQIENIEVDLLSGILCMQQNSRSDDLDIFYDCFRNIINYYLIGVTSDSSFLLDSSQLDSSTIFITSVLGEIEEVISSTVKDSEEIATILSEVQNSDETHSSESDTVETDTIETDALNPVTDSNTASDSDDVPSSATDTSSDLTLVNGAGSGSSSGSEAGANTELSSSLPPSTPKLKITAAYADSTCSYCDISSSVNGNYPFGGWHTQTGSLPVRYIVEIDDNLSEVALLKIHSVNRNSDIRKFTVYASQSDSLSNASWYELGNHELQLGAIGWQSFDIDFSSNKFRYVMVVVNSNWGYGGHTYLDELELYRSVESETNSINNSDSVQSEDNLHDSASSDSDQDTASESNNLISIEGVRYVHSITYNAETNTFNFSGQSNVKSIPQQELGILDNGEGPTIHRVSDVYRHFSENNRDIPDGLKFTCLEGNPEEGVSYFNCPFIKWGGNEYWPTSFLDNSYMTAVMVYENVIQNVIETSVVTESSSSVQSTDSDRVSVDDSDHFTPYDTCDDTLVDDCSCHGLYLSPNTEKNYYQCDFNVIADFVRLTSADVSTDNETLIAFGGTSWDQDGRVSKMMFYDKNMEGVFPTSIGRLTELNQISFRGNKIRGPIPTELGQLSKLTYLDFQNTALTGIIPDSICNLSNLEHFLIYNPIEGPGLSGELPFCMADMLSLKNMSMHNNSLSGTLSEDFCPLIDQLSYISVDGNNFEMPYPSCIKLGCQYDARACNYDPDAIVDDGSCVFPEQYYDCESNCVNDLNENGTCDELEQIDTVSFEISSE